LPGLASFEVKAGLPEFKRQFGAPRGCLEWNQGWPGAMQEQRFGEQAILPLNSGRKPDEKNQKYLLTGICLFHNLDAVGSP